MSRRTILVMVALVGCASACKDRVVHPFSAWAYNVAGSCLEKPATIDVLSGPDDGPCKEIRCWESAGHNIYITDTACSAPADYTNETNQKTGGCARALEIYGEANHGECPAGSGGGGGSGGGVAASN